MVYDWNFDVIWQYRGVHWSGARITLVLSFLSLFVAMTLGLIVGIAGARLPADDAANAILWASYV